MILPFCFTHIMKSWLHSYLRHLQPTHVSIMHNTISYSFVFFEAYTCVFVYVYEVLMSHLRNFYFLWEKGICGASKLIDVNTYDGKGKTSNVQSVHESFKMSPRMMEMHWLFHQPKEDMSWAILTYITSYSKAPRQ